MIPRILGGSTLKAINELTIPLTLKKGLIEIMTSLVRTKRYRMAVCVRHTVPTESLHNFTTDTPESAGKNLRHATQTQTKPLK